MSASDSSSSSSGSSDSESGSDSDSEHGLLELLEKHLKDKANKKKKKGKSRKQKKAKKRKTGKKRSYSGAAPRLEHSSDKGQQQHVDVFVNEEDDAESLGSSDSASEAGSPANRGDTAYGSKRRKRRTASSDSESDSKSDSGDSGPKKKAKARRKDKTELIAPKKGWKKLPPVVVDFAASALRGAASIVLNLEDAQRLSRADKGRLEKHVEDCVCRVLDEVPELTAPPGVATGVNHYADLSRRIEVFKAQNDKKDGQIEKLLEGLRTAGREMDDLENEYEDVVAHIERLESHEESLAVPPADGPLSELQIPAFLVPGQGGKPDDRLKSKAQDWAQRFQSILSHEQPS